MGLAVRVGIGRASPEGMLEAARGDEAFAENTLIRSRKYAAKALGYSLPGPALMARSKNRSDGCSSGLRPVWS